ncbi:E3 ubiquitin-protein ligase rha1b [Phtheirospermum japonicum]|uniref:E3 ubiquitin-protein ligase rha1b n=1 Tax=Phtheirospermum japonicum TaxID=374723 RepID=A0A830CYB3_9LAMI|nr:E3 ubiquitin-protein ligase rha1b [Phtheirospermum japonicum]
MICLCAETHLSTLAFTFYACVWIPFLHITQTALRFLTFLLDPHHQPETSHSEENPDWELDLPITQFQDSELSDENGGENIDGEEMCSICLMKFLKEDFVNKLPKCGHVFHVGCLEKWLDRCRFTCPLCRCCVLRVRSSPCRMWTSPFCIDLPTANHS